MTKFQAMAILKRHKKQLPISTYRTIKGQILSGDIEGAMRGLRSNRRKISNAYRGVWRVRRDGACAEVTCSVCGYRYVDADPKVDAFLGYCPDCGKPMLGYMEVKDDGSPTGTD